MCDLTTLVGKSQPTVSHHLKVLADAGLPARQLAHYRRYVEALFQGG